MKELVTLILVIASGVSLHAKRVHYPSDTLVEVQLYTNGTVEFLGPSAIVTPNKNPSKADTIIRKVEQKAQNETKILTKKEDKGKSHGNAQISVGKNANLRFQTSTGNVTLTDVEAKVKGRVESGAITVTRGTGKMELNTDKGDIVVTDSEASGFVMTRSGNVTLLDVRGQLTGISQNGKVIVKTTENYFKGRKTNRFFINYDQADIDIASAPGGGEFSLSKGNISVLNLLQSAVMQTEEGNLNVSLAGTGVRARTRKGKVSVKVTNNAASSEPILIEAQDGDVDLSLPANFAGDFVITLVQTKNLKTVNRINSSIDLGSTTPQELRDAKTKELISLETQVARTIGKSKRPVRIRVINGNVNIKQG